MEFNAAVLVAFALDRDGRGHVIAIDYIVQTQAACLATSYAGESAACA